MNIINKLTLRHLKQNKGRTTVTVLGIVISVAMITAVFVGGASFLDFCGKQAKYQNGDYHFYITENYKKLKENLESDKNIDTVGYTYTPDSDESGFRLNTDNPGNKKCGALYFADRQTLEDMVTCEYDGSFPKNGSEIMIEQELIEDNNLDWKIGDTVKIPIGWRYKDGVVKWGITGEYQYGEKFKQKEVRTFTIVGILHKNHPTYSSGKKIICGLEKEYYAGSLTALCTLKKVTPLSRRVIDDIVDKFGFSKKDRAIYVGENGDLLMSKLAIDKDSQFAVTLLVLCVVMLVIIIAASTMLIYNAFNMSYSEKVQYLGMLSSVGATKRQKKNSIYFEGLVMGVIGIPFGILSGVIGIAVTLKSVGKAITESGMMDAGKAEFKTVFPPAAAVGIILMSILTILISVFLPVRRASSISPIDAIRRQSEIKRKKKIYSPAVLKKIFGCEGEIAHKNLKRNPRKTHTIVISLTLSVVLFLSCSYFCNMLSINCGINDALTYQAEFTVNSDKYDEFIKVLRDTDGVDKFYSVTSDLLFNDSESGMSLIEAVNSDTLTKDYLQLAKKDSMGIYFFAIDDKDFNALCKANGIESEKFYTVSSNNCQPVLLLNNFEHSDDGGEIFNSSVLGKQVGYLEFDEKNSHDTTYLYTSNISTGYEISDFVEYDSDNYILNLNSGITAYYPLSMLLKAYNNPDEPDNTCSISFGIETDDASAVCETMENYFDDNEYDGASVNNIEENTRTVTATLFVIKVFIYGFVALITLITIFNIINTISTGVALKKKEFAMLRSVGTTPKGLDKMVALESMFYGLRALIFGIPISVGLSKLMNMVINAEYVVPFSLNIWLYISAVAAVFLLTGITMMYSVSKTKNSSIIETLKNDII